MKKTRKCLDHSMSAQNYHLQKDSSSSRERLEKGKGLESIARDIQVDRKADILRLKIPNW